MENQIKLIKRIGKGSFGEVFRGVYQNLPVAVKKVPITSSLSSQKYIESEFEVLKQLDHPNIVKLLQCIKSTNHIYIITELCEGRDLGYYIQKNRTIDLPVVKRILRSLLSALIYLKNKQIVHRDIKPQNILFTSNNIESGDVKIIDFGLSSFFKAGEMLISNVGSPVYMAPEVLDSSGYTYKADIWSLGVVIYECLYGVLPYDTDTLTKLRNLQKNEPAYQNHPNVDAAAKDILRKMIKKIARMRADYDELLESDFLKIEGRKEQVEHLETDERLDTNEDDERNEIMDRLIAEYLNKLPDIKTLEEIKEESESKELKVEYFTENIKTEETKKLECRKDIKKEQEKPSYLESEEEFCRYINEKEVKESISDNDLKIFNEMKERCKVLIKIYSLLMIIYSKNIKKIYLLVMGELNNKHESLIRVYSEIENNFGKTNQVLKISEDFKEVVLNLITKKLIEYQQDRQFFCYEIDDRFKIEAVAECKKVFKILKKMNRVDLLEILFRIIESSFIFHEKFWKMIKDYYEKYTRTDRRV